MQIFIQVSSQSGPLHGMHDRDFHGPVILNYIQAAQMKPSFACLSRLESDSVTRSYIWAFSDDPGRPENVPAFIEAVKKREKVLSGFGHRVYKTVREYCFTCDQH